MATGISVFGISKNNMRTIALEIPSIQEQEAIAKILTEMEAEIETLLTKLQKARFIKQGMMQNLLTGKIRLI
jgi:type I restriction enzyme S subunit